ATMPLDKTEWSELYGMFNDPFGVTWMINAE
ncbi:VOC family protein, partial [Staphylococcus cohnii]